MAWGLSHGMVPYRDTINMNWPGAILVHVAARAVSGKDGIGLRLLDSFALVLLCLCTSWVLYAYRVALPLRLAALAAYLTSYVGTGVGETAQRESFALP